MTPDLLTSGGYRGGQTRPMPPLTNKDTPPVHGNEFNYVISAGARLVSAPDPTDAAADGLHHRYASARPVVRAKYHP